MGCNYYLKYKGNLSIEEHNKYVDISERVQVLDNGFVYKNKYYETLPSYFPTLLHIGKSSYGWHFSLCIYPFLGINNLDDWKNLFDKFVIEDECGETVSKERMLSTILDRKGSTDRDKEYVEEFCRKNSCEPGLNNLFAHKSTGYTHYERSDGTYDLTEDWDFC